MDQRIQGARRKANGADGRAGRHDLGQAGRNYSIFLRDGLLFSYLEYVDHLHEHFLHPVDVTGGRYRVPTAPGYSIEMRPESLTRYRYPGGAQWA